MAIADVKVGDVTFDFKDSCNCCCWGNRPSTPPPAETRIYITDDRSVRRFRDRDSAEKQQKAQAIQTIKRMAGMKDGEAITFGHLQRIQDAVESVLSPTAPDSPIRSMLSSPTPQSPLFGDPAISTSTSPQSSPTDAAGAGLSPPPDLSRFAKTPEAAPPDRPRARRLKSSRRKTGQEADGARPPVQVPERRMTRAITLEPAQIANDLLKGASLSNSQILKLFEATEKSDNI